MTGLDKKVEQSSAGTPSTNDYMKGHILRKLKEQKQAEESQLAKYAKEHKAPTADDVLKPLREYVRTNKVSEMMKAPNAHDILKSVDLSSLDPLVNQFKPGDQENKSLLTQVREALEMSKKAQGAKDRATGEPALKIFYSDIQRHPGDTVEDIESKIAQNVKKAENLLKEFDKEFDVLREKPENKSMFSSLAQYETTRKEKKSRLQLREIQIGYQVVAKMMDELKSNPENNITSHDIERTRLFFWNYAKNAGEVRGWQINRRESGKTHDEQRAMDIFREVYLSDYEAWLRARHLADNTIHND